MKTSSIVLHKWAISFFVIVGWVKKHNDVSPEKIQQEIEQINKNLSKIEKIKKFFIIKDQFTIENGMMTPTLKLKRYKIIKNYELELKKLY